MTKRVKVCRRFYINSTGQSESTPSFLILTNKYLGRCHLQYTNVINLADGFYKNIYYFLKTKSGLELTSYMQRHRDMGLTNSSDSNAPNFLMSQDWWWGNYSVMHSFSKSALRKFRLFNEVAQIASKSKYYLFYIV